MTTRVLGWIMNVVTLLLFITPLVNLAFIFVQAKIVNLTLIDYFAQTNWIFIYMLGTLCIPVAAILMQIKWRRARLFKRHAKEYFCLSLLMTTIALILMGEYSMVIFMIFLILASSYPLGIKYNEAFAMLREPSSFRKLAGEWLILFIAVIVRICMYTGL
ncbi:hypothetical protein APT62_00750 [Aerococcus urinaeequi]|uniref:hypothetical protein n=1 Tax=Aerococcus urinaeequi TaxID=51665 RepID=UPI000744A704|nr:hypothetical protein [Aerococcus urinaeequi]ALZ87066.1 hypothetical protein APT62_00750 [Aerococcus urinaeequi]MDT2762212.1 hypothetical protein [Aerococcus urinaeequi]